MIMYAFASFRAEKRQGGSRVVRHAVDNVSYWSGAHDTLCGYKVTMKLGSWETEHPDNCLRCAARVAKALKQELKAS